MSHTFSDGQTLCPYNDSHVVSRLRVIPHLVKCRQVSNVAYFLFYYYLVVVNCFSNDVNLGCYHSNTPI